MGDPSEGVELAFPARERDLGGFQVGRVLPYAKRRMVGPFIFLDHLGPLQLAAPVPRSADVRPHPHIGLATVTYLFAGELTHRDSLGVEQVIRPGEVNWMTAGRGISHSERFDSMRDSGGPLHGMQAWVALPTDKEEIEPAFEHYGRADIPAIALPGVTGSMIAGSAFGASSSVRTLSPLFYAHLQLQPGARVELPDEYSERGAYVVSGAVEWGGRGYASKTMLVFAGGSAVALTATARSTVMVLGGEPVGPRHIWWNFVSSRKERIEQAKADWSARRIPLPPTDSDELIPLPDGL
ncbi:MAG TPA: pirin family protein [Burkholderiaceae bacterium]|nr:pirin family protein [Burkholderiaceae bacterium]